MIDRKPIFECVDEKVPGVWNIPGTIKLMDALLDLVPDDKPVAGLTEKIVLEIVEHEAITLEWYKDSVGVGTWSVGITNASGHSVDRYKDNPQTIEHALKIYIWLLREKYLPPVLEAFDGCKLSEHQLGAALSFHWNTGAIKRTSWVKLFKQGEHRASRTFLETHYLNGGLLRARRKAEAALFFDGTWTSDGKVIVWPVKKPSYTPDWRKPQLVDITKEVREMLA